MELVNDGLTRKRKLNWNEVELSGTPALEPGKKGLAQVDEILVGKSLLIKDAPLTCRNNNDISNGGPLAGDYSCMQPLGGMEFYNVTENNAYLDKLERYIAGTGNCKGNNCTELATCSGLTTESNYKNNCVDGWRKDFWPYNNREKNVGQATLLGGLVTFTTYQPNSGVCQAEGSAYLYGVYYKTGTSWHENIFGEYGIGTGNNIKNKLSLGRGLATTPNLFVGAGSDGGKAFVQTSTGEIKEINQAMPLEDYKTGPTKWKECTP
jgi:type IV pilus assembly protein PilY1